MCAPRCGSCQLEDTHTIRADEAGKQYNCELTALHVGIGPLLRHFKELEIGLFADVECCSAKFTASLLRGFVWKTLETLIVMQAVSRQLKTILI